MNQKARLANSFADNSLLTVDSELNTKLSQALIKLCLHDGEEASRVLSVKLSNINTQLSGLKIKIAEGIESSSMSYNVEIALSEIVDAVMQLQFFDRISQRLDHATQSLEFCNNTVKNGKPMVERFTMEDERALYNALLYGESVDQAVVKASTRLNVTLNKADGDDIELF